MTDPALSSLILEADPNTFDGLVLDLGAQIPFPPLVIAYFWGPDCPNCEVFARHLPGLLPELEEPLRSGSLRFVKVNAYAYPELARRFGIFGIPTFILARGGKVLGKMTSFQGDEYFLAVVREQLSRENSGSR